MWAGLVSPETLSFLLSAIFSRDGFAPSHGLSSVRAPLTSLHMSIFPLLIRTEVGMF